MIDGKINKLQTVEKIYKMSIFVVSCPEPLLWRLTPLEMWSVSLTLHPFILWVPFEGTDNIRCVTFLALWRFFAKHIPSDVGWVDILAKVRSLLATSRGHRAILNVNACSWKCCAVGLRLSPCCTATCACCTSFVASVAVGLRCLTTGNMLTTSSSPNTGLCRDSNAYSLNCT